MGEPRPCLVPLAPRHITAFLVPSLFRSNHFQQSPESTVPYTFHHHVIRASMYCYLRQRYSTILQECEEILSQKSAMVPPARTINHDSRSRTPVSSTASSPSLRSKTPVNVPMAPSNLNPGGNVKVVVRVRGFLPRGNYHHFLTCKSS